MGYLAKALLMTTPAGDVIRAYGDGRKLAGRFDDYVGNTPEEKPEVRQKSPEEEKKELLLNLVIEDYSRKLYNEPANPANNTPNNNDADRNNE